MIKRYILNKIQEALSDTPVVLLSGARQTGKSTLAKWLAEGSHPARYVTLDDATVFASIKQDPAGFIQGLDGAVVIDEVQRVPELFSAIKLSVDRKRDPGRFLLTGSANVLLLPRLSDSLAGRMEILTLWPFSQGEWEGGGDAFVDNVFHDQVPFVKGSENRSDLMQRLLKGGYPEMLNRVKPARRRAWFSAYTTTILQRDVKDLAQIDGLTVFPRLLSLLAARTGTILNIAELSRSVGLPQTTLKRYLALLEMTFLTVLLPPWSGNFSKRLVKTPKLYLNDTGLAAHLLGVYSEEMLGDGRLLGPLLENFVLLELLKQASWSETQPRLFYFRTQAGQEIDVVMEDPAGRIVGIEIKAAATLTRRDFAALKDFSESMGDAFHRGIILYTGSESVSFGKNLHALPVSTLWNKMQDLSLLAPPNP
jgi:predicted AAA+ superfamily ATPase